MMSGLIRNEFPHMPSASRKDAIRKQLSGSQEKSPHPNPPCWFNTNIRFRAYKTIKMYISVVSSTSVVFSYGSRR